MQTAAKLHQCQFHTEVSNVEAKKNQKDKSAAIFPPQIWQKLSLLFQGASLKMNGKLCFHCAAGLHHCFSNN